MEKSEHMTGLRNWSFEPAVWICHFTVSYLRCVWMRKPGLALQTVAKQKLNVHLSLCHALVWTRLHWISFSAPPEDQCYPEHFNEHIYSNMWKDWTGKAPDPGSYYLNNKYGLSSRVESSLEWEGFSVREKTGVLTSLYFSPPFV